MKVPAFVFLFLSSVSICSAWAGTEASGSGGRSTYESSSVMCALPASGWTITRRDIPDSTVIEDAAVALRSPTNDEINAAEVWNPESPDYRNKPAVEITGNVNAEWEAAEAGNPDVSQPGNLAAVAATSPAGNCDRIAADARQQSRGQN